MFAFSSELEAEIYFKESALESALLDHKVRTEIDLYEQIVFLEGADSPKAKSFPNRILSAIKLILDKIGKIISGFLDAIKSSSDNRLTVDEYMQSETHEKEVAVNLQKMIDDCEEEYLAMRKCVQSISKATGIDPKAVAAFADMLDAHAYENRYKIEGVVKAGSTFALKRTLRHTLVKNMENTKKFQKQIEDSIQKIKDTDLKFDAMEKRKLASLQTLVNRMSFAAERWQRLCLTYTTARGTINRGIAEGNAKEQKDLKKKQSKERKEQLKNKFKL